MEDRADFIKLTGTTRQMRELAYTENHLNSYTKLIAHVLRELANADEVNRLNTEFSEHEQGTTQQRTNAEIHLALDRVKEHHGYARNATTVKVALEHYLASRADDLDALDED